MVKLTALKLANAVKCGPNEELFLTAARFDMTLSGGMFVKITHHESKQVCNTTLMNVIWWHEAPTEAPAKATDEAERGRPAAQGLRAKGGQ